MYGTFYKEVLARTTKETIGFTKRKVAFASTMAVGLAIALSMFGIAHLTTAALQRNLIIIISVYVTVLVLCFLWNFLVAAPVFLDNQLRTRLARAEIVKDESGYKLELRNKFADLMEEGRVLYNGIGNLRGEDLESWDGRLEDWHWSVRIAADHLGFPSDYHEFMRATDDADPVGGSIDLRGKHENRRRKLKKQQQKLEDIVKRRLH
jgi:hypothetical protein